MGVIRRLAVALGVCALLASGSAAAVEDLDFRGARVVDVIDAFEQAGYEFFYSSGLVRGSLRFKSNPPAGSPIERFRLALGELGLDLVSENGVQRVVRASRAAVRTAIRGRVIDASTGLPVPGVKVIVGGTSATTDELGQFELVPRSASPVSVSRAGYESKVLAADAEVSALLEIPLTPVEEMDEIVVVSSRYAVHTAQTETHLIDHALIDSIPRLGEDPVRIANHLPGIASLGVSAKPHIRGGSQDELLVLFNNLELLEPFHLRDFQSVFSSFNPSVIESIDVYTGGFPARYGDRMSGVMDIDPADNELRTGGELSLSLLNASGLLHGTLQDGRGEWVVSARRGNLDIVTREINSTVGDPAYSDWFAQLRYEIDGETELDVGVFAYNDDVELRDFDEDGEIANSRYDNFYAWAQLHRAWAPGLDGSSVLYYGKIDHERDGVLVDLDLEDGEAFVHDDRAFELISLGQHFRYALSDGLFAEFGVRLTYQDGRYDYRANIERGELASIIGTEPDLERAIYLQPSGLSGGVYGSLRVQPTDRLTLEGGLRWDYQDYTGDGARDQISPRLSARYDFSDDSELRLSAGRFYQPEAIHELQVGDGIDRYQDVQYSDHYILGWYQRFGDTGFSLRTELFRKDFHDPKRRFENLFNPLVLLPELASDRVEIAPSKARARGAEMTLRYQSGERLVAWLTYSRSESEDYLNRRWQPRTWDQGRTFSSGFSWEMSAWTIAATILWNDGWRTTALPAFIAADEEAAFMRNRDRLRDYLSVDIQASRTWEWPRQSLTLFAELTNVLNRRNVGGIEYDVEEDEDTGDLLLTPQSETLLPLVPSIGVRWRF